MLKAFIAAVAVTTGACSAAGPEQSATATAGTSAQPQADAPAVDASAQPPITPAQQPPSPVAQTTAAPAAAAPPTRAPAPPPAPPKRHVANLQAGQQLTIRTTRLLSTKTMKTG